MDLNALNAFLQNPIGQLIFVLLTIWSLVWKGFALWKAARNARRGWFIAMLVINSLGILEIVYIFYFAGERRRKTKQPGAV